MRSLGATRSEQDARHGHIRTLATVLSGRRCSPLVADAVLPRYSDGGPLDELGVGSFGGSFLFSAYSNAKHQVTAAVSGCTPP